MENREWKFDDSVGLIFAGVAAKTEKVFSPCEDSVCDEFNELVDKAAKDPEAAIGHLTAITYRMGFAIAKLKQENDRLRKNLNSHNHKDAVVVSY